MTIDLSKQAVVGATLVSNKGWRHVIKEGDTLTKVGHPIREFYIDIGEYLFKWRPDGTALRSEAAPLGNIIEVIPPAFDWATVKRGMAFETKHTRPMLFVGMSNIDGKKAILENGMEGTGINLWYYDISELTRAPEHDKVGE